MARPRVKRDPICPWCRQRHPYGQAVGWHDDQSDKWHCGRCDGLLDGMGECTTPKCCGFVPDRPTRWRRVEHTTSTAASKYTLNLVGLIR